MTEQNPHSSVFYHWVSRLVEPITSSASRYVNHTVRAKLKIFQVNLICVMKLEFQMELRYLSFEATVYLSNLTVKLYNGIRF